MLLEFSRADARTLVHREVTFRTGFLLYDLRKEVNGRVLDETEEFTPVFQQEVADLLLRFLF